MPKAIQIGKKASRISPALAAQMAAGAVVPGALSVEQIESEATPEVVKTPEQIAAETAAAALLAAGTKTPEQIAAEAAAAAGGEEEEEEVPSPELTARVTELETNLTTLNTQLTTAKGVSDHLQSQLNAANENLGATKVELTAAKASATALKTGNEALRSVVMDATKNLSVAFSTQPPVLDSLNDADLCTQYTSLRTRFDKAYLVGGKTKATDEVGKPPLNLLEDEHPAASAATRVTSLPHRRQVNK